MLFLLLSCRMPVHEKESGMFSDCPLAYLDADGDGFGTEEGATHRCEQEAGWAAVTGDCDDTRGSIFPGAPEVCNAMDDDCDGEVDEEAVDASVWFTDGDGDGFGDDSTAARACAGEPGQVAQGSDCDDQDPTIFPGSVEIEGTGIDEDCDGRVDEIRVCAEGTGFSTITEAVAAAPVEGATIEVCPGMYKESLDLSGRNLTLVGETGDPKDVVVDGSGIGPAIHYDNFYTETSGTYIIDGFTFIGNEQGALLLYGGASVDLRHFIVRDTRIAYEGSLIEIYSGRAILSDCEVFENESNSDSFGPIITMYPSSLSYVQRCSIHNNGQTDDGFYRGVLSMSNTIISNNLFYENKFRNSTVEQVIPDNYTQTQLYNNTFIQNEVSGSLILIFLDANSVYEQNHNYRNNIFCNNVALDIISYDKSGWGSCYNCDQNEDRQCSEQEALDECRIPIFEYNWLCQNKSNECAGYWCDEVVTYANPDGTDLNLSIDTLPPFSLPANSPAIDRGDPAPEFNDADGTMNDPGRYGGPNAFE